MSQITGRALIKINGNLQKSRPGATIRLGGFSRATQNGDDSVHGYSEAIVSPRIEATFSHDKNTNMTELDNLTDASIIFETDSGKTYIMSEAWRSDDPGTLSTQDGSIPYVFEGLRCEEM